MHSLNITCREERIVHFARAGAVAFGVGSFTTGLASKMPVVAVEETTLRKIKKQKIEELSCGTPRSTCM